MILEGIYSELKSIIDRVDFNALWEGFKPFKFAIYNDEKCFFDGAYVPKTEVFLANTAILYSGEYIAIWKITPGQMDLDVLASKIIHEMFHAHQMQQGEFNFPNELEALVHYRYTVENLSLKMEENNLLCHLSENFSEAAFKHFVSLRKYRQLAFEYEYGYETAIEHIEGSANYVELSALKQISKEKHKQKRALMLAEVVDPLKCMPIRIVSYAIGALLFDVLKQRNIRFGEMLMDDVSNYTEELPLNPEIQKTIEGYNAKTEAIIQEALDKDQCVLEGEYELCGVNVYDARSMAPYIVTTYFVMYKDEGIDSVLYGDFVVQLNDNHCICNVYKL